MENMTGIPLAYFITFTCYGTWLHGEKQTSVDRFTNILGTPFLTYNRAKAYLVKTQMSEDAYLLDYAKRKIVLNAILAVCNYRQWTVFAVHVRTNHVHVVIRALCAPELIMNTIKAYASRHLNEALSERKKNRWTRHGSTIYLWREEEIEATIQYVIRGQGEAMALYENVDRIVRY